jgi:murein L,D-transpeptidase YcbB/YkuD
MLARALFAVLLLLQAPAPAEQAQALIRARFPASGAAPQLRLGGETFRGSAGLPCFYERRGYAPAWIGTQADALLGTLSRATEDGLNPEEYHAAGLRQLAAQARSPAELSELDLLLTDAFLRYAAHVQSGRVDPRDLYSDCQASPPATDLPAVLESALGAGNLQQVLADLPPPHEDYRRLRAALARYRQVAARGGWVDVPDGPTLRAGDQGERVAALRARLLQAAEADAAAPVPQGPDLLDEPFVAALRAFQERHGLEPDGVAGPATLGALAEPAAAHVRQIEINLERWRWLPRDLGGKGERYVLVNIAGFRLDAVEDGRTALDMKIIVGKPYTRTPMFTGAMTRVVLNPYWYVPNSIATKEIAPRLRRDPDYLRREGFEVIPGKGFALRQRPGPKNALGRVKFLFPNRFNVYLHDTPSRSLFDRTVRTFSHGCIRIEKPVEMAEWVLRPLPEWTPAAIQGAIAAGRERNVVLPRPIPVHVTYWTAWIDAAGTLQIRHDVYGRDEPLDQALGEAE